MSVAAHPERRCYSCGCALRWHALPSADDTRSATKYVGYFTYSSISNSIGVTGRELLTVSVSSPTRLAPPNLFNMADVSGSQDEDLEAHGRGA